MPEKKEHKEEHKHKEEHQHKKKFKIGLWEVSTIALLILLVASIFTKGFVSSAAITQQEASEKALSAVNILLQGQATAKVVDVTESEGVYKIKLDIGGRPFDSYITKDGKLFFPQAYTLEELQNITQQTQQQPQETPKTEKPSVELFVMSFCPYGVQAETLLKPVIDLLGAKADIKVRFIASVGGDTIDSVQSLHGASEAKEDLRQLCIQKNYPSAYWKYLTDFNKECYPKYSDSAALDVCWKNVSSRYNIDTAAVESCMSSEGLSLLKADEALTEQYSVSGSPTLIINGAQYSGTRSSEAFKTAICNAFTTKPTECSQTLSSSSSSAQGGC